MKKLIIIAMVLLAIPAMAMADYKTDRAELMASAGLFNVAALDNSVYAKQAEGMAKDSSRGRVSISGSLASSYKERQDIDIVKDNSYINNDFLSFYRFTGEASDRTDVSKYTFFYNNGTIFKGIYTDNRGNNRSVSYSQYSSRRP